MKSKLQNVNDHGTHYTALTFVCPGCASARPGYDGLHMLPVNSPDCGKPSWDWDGNLEAPTLSPSILTHLGDVTCHSFLKDGVFDFLGDCTHPLVNQKVPLPDLPDWAVELS